MSRKRIKHTWKGSIEGKVCSRCLEWKPLEQYYDHPIYDSWDGKARLCKSCVNLQRANYYIKCRDMKLAQVKEYQESHPQDHRIYNREYRRSHPRYWSTPSNKESHLRRRAQTSKLEAINSKEWLDTLTLFDNRCAYCDGDGVLTQDHIVPVSEGGKHTTGNLVPACRSCNSSKQAKDMLAWYEEQPFFSLARLELIQSIPLVIIKENITY